jgi:hypothetical protein
MWNSGHDLFESDGEHGWLNWFVVAFVLYALIVSLVVVPRWLAPKILEEGQEGRLFVIGLAFAVAPFLVAFASAGAGGDTWAMTLGLVVSVVLLFLNARTMASRSSAQA